MNDLDQQEAAREDDSQAQVKTEVDVGLATVRQLFSFGSGPKKRYGIILGLICAFIAGCVYPGMAFYFAKSFEELAAPTSSDSFMSEIRKLAYAFMVMGAVVLASMSAYAMLLETAATEMTISLKTEWFNALLRQDLAYFDIKDVSGTSSLISTNGAKYKSGVGRKLGMGVQFLVTFVGCMGYAFYASWKTSLVVLTIIPFMALSTWFVLKMNQSQSARNNASYAEAGSIVYTAVSSIRTILSLNAVQSMIGKFKGATEKARILACSQLHLIGLANGSMMGSFFLSFIAVTLFGSYILYDQVRKNGCDPSGATGNDKCDPAAMDVFGCLMGITFAAGVLPQLSNSIESFAGARAACYLATSTMNRKIDMEEKDSDLSQSRNAARRGSSVPLPKYVIDSSSPDGLKPESVNGRIEFRNATFSYPTRKEINVFDGFSLDVPAGSTVALVGPSGSGKSTSVQLLERFYDPKAGSITLDGHDLRELNVKWLRQHIGLVSQEPKLFACSIKENIAYGYPGATMEQIEEAARMANAHDFIKTFPEGYDTQVGDLGGKLSGGQKQRIAIARVLVKDPKIILLDEATSALDSESEGIVQQALDRLMKDGSRTIIVIAHRLSTIRNADLIAVVHEGKVVETGKHDELISAQGRYYELVEAQKAPPVPTENGMSKSEHSSAPSSRRSSELDLQGLDSPDSVPLLHFNNVHFTYPSRPDNEVFRGLNLSVYPGETLALVGPSGHGKSTTVQLIERFYDPDDGTIELDGVDLKSLNVQWLREQVGLVSQEPMLFDTSIAENIRFGRESATQEEIEEAAREANAHDFILSFPDGYDTQVGGSGGTQVSGGQKQRLAIARALLRKPRILLLDEATSSLDSESERIVQAALEKVMAATERTTIVIAHRLSTIRNADRIAVISDGKVREVGTHDELMAKQNGRYRRLQAFQNLEKEEDRDRQQEEKPNARKVLLREDIDGEEDTESTESLSDVTNEVDKERAKRDARRSRVLAKDDRIWFFVGSVGAVLGGAIFPGMGFIFAYMIDVLYSPVFACTDPAPFDSCQDYWNFQADEMKDLAGRIAWGSFGLIVASLVGFTLLYYGFGKASENMNKRVRDVAFVALVRQEVAYFDMRPVGTITSRIQEDAALIHSFSGQPIRTLVLNLASVLVGLVISFVYMWPFALLTLAILPFLAFGAEMEMRMYMGEDEGDDSVEDEDSPGGIVVETLVNIRTVASLTIEETRSSEYVDALRAEDPTPYRSNFIKGIGLGLGQFFQFYGIGLMMWWGGWLLYNYPDLYEYRDFLISMFSLLFSLYGVAVAAEGATDRERAKLAAKRIFDLTDRESAIDPLSAEGKKGV